MAPLEHVFDYLTNTDAVDGDYVASIRFRLVHLVVVSHLVRSIVHLLAGYLIVDVLRSKAVVVARSAARGVVIVPRRRLECVESRHARSIMQIKVGPLVLEARV